MRCIWLRGYPFGGGCFIIRDGEGATLVQGLRRGSSMHVGDMVYAPAGRSPA